MDLCSRNANFIFFFKNITIVYSLRNMWRNVTFSNTFYFVLQESPEASKFGFHCTRCWVVPVLKNSFTLKADENCLRNMEDASERNMVMYISPYLKLTEGIFVKALRFGGAEGETHVKRPCHYSTYDFFIVAYSSIRGTPALIPSKWLGVVNLLKI